MNKFSKNTLIWSTLSLIVFAGVVFSIKSIRDGHLSLLSSVISSVMIDLTNMNRVRNNLSALETSPQLTAAAQLKADDMAKKGYFSHISPEGISPWYWLYISGYDFAYAGENLAVNFNDSEETVQAWMDSKTHKANILSDKFTQIGIATATGTYDGREATYVVQFFGRPSVFSSWTPAFSQVFGN